MQNLGMSTKPPLMMYMYYNVTGNTRALEQMGMGPQGYWMMWTNVIIFDQKNKNKHFKKKSYIFLELYLVLFLIKIYLELFCKNVQ